MIIGISGKKQSGKDTVAKIIQYLSIQYRPEGSNWTTENLVDYLKNPDPRDSGAWLSPSKWQIKRFADKLKDIVCLLINCTREQLEDNEFKEKPLGVEWMYWMGKGFRDEIYLYITNEEAIEAKRKEYIYSFNGPNLHTPRTLLQLIGTECGRNIIHPNIWTNTLMSEYEPEVYFMCDECMADNILEIKEEDTCPKCGYKSEDNLTKVISDRHSNWIIPDVRFPNEVEVIEKRDGIVLRLERSSIPLDNHESETSLDNHTFKYVIDNNGTIEDLVDNVKHFLQEIKII